VKDRREPEARRLLGLFENDFTPHVYERMHEALTIELARTDDTETLVFEAPDSKGLTLTVRGFAPTLTQRLLRRFRK